MDLIPNVKKNKTTREKRKKTRRRRRVILYMYTREGETYNPEQHTTVNNNDRDKHREGNTHV